jgi:hypothetical protein
VSHLSSSRSRQVDGPRRSRVLEWWAYFGSFGDDFFTECGPECDPAAHGDAMAQSGLG